MTRFYRMIALFLFLVTSPSLIESVTWAEQPSENNSMGDASGKAWETAKTLYDSQKFQEALEALQAAAPPTSENSPKNAAYYYDVGTLYLRLAKFGLATAYLEKANHLRPRDSEIQSNLALARSSLGQSIGPEKLDPASNHLEQTLESYSMDEIRLVLGFLGILFLLLWLRIYLKTRSVRLLFSSPLGVLGLAGIILTCCIFAVIESASNSPPAFSLVLHSVRSGPGEHYSELTKLEPGTEIRLLPTPTESSTDSTPDTKIGKPSSEITTWQQVRYSREGIGWVKISNLLVL